MNAGTSHHAIRRIASVWLIGLPLLCALVYLAALEWRGERLSSRLTQAGASFGTPGELPMVPFMEHPWRLLARGADADTAATALRKALELRPLYAPTWLELAELAYRQGDDELAAEHADHARLLWPAHPGLLWRVAGWYTKSGFTGAALDTLRDYWRVEPHAPGRVLSLAARLERDPWRLYQAVVPEAATPGIDADYHPRQFQNHAYRSRDALMAIAGWRSAPESLRSDTAEALRYIDFLRGRGRTTEAIDAWRELTGATEILATIHDSGFESPLIGGGFGWRAYATAGADIHVDDRNTRSGQGALRVDFDGSANTNFHHLRQTIVVAPAARYRLQGWWRGEDITTRSGVFVDLRTLDAGQDTYARSAHRYGSWDWQPFDIEFEVPADASLAELRVRRAPTDALDHLIGGRVWFDDFTLTRVSG